MVQHLLAVQQVCAGLAQVAQVYLQREKGRMTERTGGAGPPPGPTCAYLHVMEQLGQVKLPLLAEV